MSILILFLTKSKLVSMMTLNLACDQKGPSVSVIYDIVKSKICELFEILPKIVKNH